MNAYINAQIMQMCAYTKTWEQSCQLAAKKNDGVIDKEEEKQLKQIEKATERFIKELKSIK